MKKFLIAACGACLLCFTAAWAEEPEENCPPGVLCSDEDSECPPGTECPKSKKKVRLSTVETVEVVSGFQAGAVLLEPTRTVIDIEKFEASGSVDRVEDVLKHMTGIDIMQGTGGADPQQMVMMRGMDDSRFQVAINGRPITAPTAGSDTFVDWSSLTMGDIERIEVIRGSASARYENAVGGVINIITRKGNRGDSAIPKMSSDVSYSTFNTFSARGGLSGGIGQLGYFINFGSRQSDGFLMNNYWNGMDYSGRMDYLFPWKGSVTTTFKRSELDHGYPVVNDPNSQLAVFNPDYPIMTEDADTIRMGRLISYPGGKSYKIKKKSQIDLAYEQPFTNSHLSFKYFTDRGSEDSWSYQRNSPTGTRLVQTYQGSTYTPGSASNATSGDRKERTSGVMFDYNMNFWNRHAVAIGYSQRRMDVHDTPDVYRIQGAYIEDQYAVTDRLIFTMGLRYMHVREYSYPYVAPGETERARHLIYTREWLPKFTATFRFNTETEVFASVSRDYHVPGC